MPKANKEEVTKAFELYRQGLKLVDIAKQLGRPDSTIRRWKHDYNWDSSHATKKTCARRRRRVGGQPHNKNSVGHAPSVPLRNENAVKNGLFRKYLPQETLDIIDQMPKDPLDILWDQITIAHAAIVRAQQIMYVKDKDDQTKNINFESFSDKGESTGYDIQQAWDKQANFMKSQARAQTALQHLIKQYDEMLHKNWELATDEQKARIAVMQAKATPDVKEDDDRVIIVNDLKDV